MFLGGRIPLVILVVYIGVTSMVALMFAFSWVCSCFGGRVDKWPLVGIGVKVRNNTRG